MRHPNTSRKVTSLTAAGGPSRKPGREAEEAADMRERSRRRTGVEQLPDQEKLDRKTGGENKIANFKERYVKRTDQSVG